MTLISWPVAADYDEAIQNPHLNFADPELKGSEPVFDDYGSPEVRSGNFASVYMVKTANRSMAVRCFLREVADQQERYAAISHDLLGLGLPYTVDFEFITKGIKIQGNWFPVLKMDWCNGELLDDYILRNIDNPVKLRRLSDKWYEMTVALRKEGIAHGDLQHGNIMVAEDEFKLIDYDGMFVPRLAGRKSNERGLEHYQHPKRTDAHFGRYLDTFANWVIYTTLFALGEDKTLWRFVNIEDKHLIFSKKDFEKPEASEIFDVLKKHDDKTIRTYATTIENLLQYEVDKLPDFSPDKPVLYPPSVYTAPVSPASKRPADKSVSFQPIDEEKLKLLQAEKGGDRGGLYGDRDKPARVPGGDRGGLHDTAAGGDRGGLHDRVPGGDRGNLVQQDKGGDRGNLMRGDRGELSKELAPPPAKRPIWVPIVIGVLALAGLGGTGYGVMQMTSHNPAEKAKESLTKGVGYVRELQYDDARDNFEKVLNDTTQSRQVRSNAGCMLALSYIKVAGEQGRKKDLDKAQKILQEVEGDDPNNADAFYIEGKLLRAENKVADALKALRKAKNLDSNKLYKDEYEEVHKLVYPNGE